MTSPLDAPLDTPFVCFLNKNTTSVFGPMPASEAMEFTSFWNDFLARCGLDADGARWVAVPLRPLPENKGY